MTKRIYVRVRREAQIIETISIDAPDNFPTNTVKLSQHEFMNCMDDLQACIDGHEPEGFDYIEAHVDSENVHEETIEDWYGRDD